MALLVLTPGNTNLDVSKIDTNAVQAANSQNGDIADHVSGKIGSKVTLIEYGDYQCPPCGNIYYVVKSLSEHYKDQIQVVFRNFPVTDSHPNAKAAAGTVEAAGLQGKFWEMHNKIYETQTDWSDLSINERGKFFTDLASELGLNMTKFNTDLASTAVNKKINYDYEIGKKAGVDATPTFYLNGIKLTPENYGEEAKFKDTINAALTKAGIDLPE